MSGIDIDGGNDTTYEEDLEVTLLLESDGKKHKVVSSNIENFKLEFNPYGFDGYVHFSGFDNKELEDVFTSEKPIDVTFSYQTEKMLTEKKESVVVKGFVYRRLSRGIEKEKKEIRVYQIHFCDVLRVSWSSHYPKGIYIDKTMKDVIEAEKSDLINLEYDWDALNEEHPILAFSLEDNYHKREEKKGSFYSFFHWFLHRDGGILEYNYKENKYKILGEKSSDGDPLPVAEYWITSPCCVYPQLPRHINKKMKYFPDKVEDEVDENDKAYPSIRKDWYEEDIYTSFPEQSGENVKSPPTPQKMEATFWVIRFAETFQFDQLFPGTQLSFKGSKKVEGQWCDHAIFKDAVFRIRSTKIKGENMGSSQGVGIGVLPYELTIEVLAEEKDETFIPRPLYCPPQYPFYISGTIFSDIGEEEQTTFNVTKDETYPQGKYQVKVPLSGEEEKYVVVPFTPDFISGQYYFPYCKEQQVMLRMDFKTATLHRILNWQPLAELPEGDQGCQIMWSSDGPDKYVFQKHEFEDGKDSVLTIKQSSSKEQTQTIVIKEKEMILTVEEDKKRTTQIHFNRDTGLLIKVHDESAGMTNTSLYDDKAITHTSEGSGGTSTIVQEPDSVAITVDSVTFKCEELKVDAKKAVTIKAASKVLLDTPLTKATQEMSVG